MPRLIEGVDDLKEYVDGVLARADDHGRTVDEISLTIAGAIIWRADSIRVFETQGQMRNALWIQIGDRRYYLTYGHDERAILIRRDNNRGEVIGSFTNQNTAGEVRRFFAGL